MGISFKRRMADSLGEPATVIGPGIEIVGTLNGGGHFLILGTVVGNSALKGPVTIAAGARWEGALGATDVVLDGDVSGDIVASGRIEIRAGARVTGTVAGASIAIAEGAIIEGELTTTANVEVKRFIERRSKPSRSQHKKSAGK